MPENKPAYIKLFKSGELYERIKHLSGKLQSCNLCPRNCFVNRLKGELGYCGAGKNLKVASAFQHFGEEPPLVGSHGSGTIFLSFCNLKCNFCQNYDISHYGDGEEITSNELATLMIDLQNKGCHNINFVTPTHFAPQIIAALPKAIEMGLSVSIVWNCGGYESLEIVRLLDGIVDIYMPDAKFSNSNHAKQFADAGNYFTILKEILKEMFRQVGTLKIDKNGAAFRGLLIRHLVLPKNAAGSKHILKFIAEALSTDNYVNIMSQYRPCYQAISDPQIGRAITNTEFGEAIRLAWKLGLSRGFRTMPLT
ncbi:radical SAM protein [candidate division KSB1 bacterium]|nr:radical SAM protein [candidate division KSB1 bacterium]MBL7095974.1 radical SAM protein [candidate division KSB1 bacterium]